MKVAFTVRYRATGDEVFSPPVPDSEEFIESDEKRSVLSDENDPTNLTTIGRFPFESEGAAADYFDKLLNDLDAADSYKVSVRMEPLGGVHTSEVQEWYETNEEYQPDNGEIPRVWDSSRHIIIEESG